MKKLSLKEFKTQISTQDKNALLDELAGGILAACHCGPGEYPDCAPYDC